MALLVLTLLQTEAAEAIRRTRAEKTYEVRYRGEGKLPNGDPFQRSGLAVWRAPGILVLDGEASGRRKELAVRAGLLHACTKHLPSYAETPCEACGEARRPTTLPRVWVYAAGRWMTADEASDSWAAAGARNPDELLAALAEVASQAAGLEIALKGKAAAGLARKLAQGNDFEEATAVVGARIKADAQGRIASLTIQAFLKGAAGAVDLTADLQFDAYGTAQVPAQPGKVPILKAVKSAIDAELGK